MSPEAVRTTRLYCAFQLFFSLLFWLPVFYEYQKRIGLTDPEIFRIQSLYYLAFCLMEIPTGMVADFLGYRRCLRAGAATLVAANLLPILARGYDGFLAHFLLIALARSFISGASSAWLYCWLQGQGRTAEFKLIEGKARAWGLASKVVGWSAIGRLMEWELTLPYWLTVASAVVSLAIAWALPDVRPPEAPPGEADGIRVRLRATAATVLGSPWIMLIMAQGVAVFVLARIVQVNLFQPVLEQKGMGLEGFGLVMAAMTACEAVGSANPGLVRGRLTDFGAVSVLTIGLAAVLLLLPAAATGGAIVLLCAFAFATGLCAPIQRQLLNDAIPDSRLRATILSVESIVDRAVNAWTAGLIGTYLAAGLLGDYLRDAGLVTLGVAAFLHVLRARATASSPQPAPVS